MVDKVALGERLQKVRTNEKIRSARQMASLLGIDASYYTKSEKGEGLGDEPLRKIMEKWGYSRNWLLFGEGPEKGQNTPHGEPPHVLKDGTPEYGHIDELEDDLITKATVRDLAKSTLLQSESMKGFSDSMKGFSDSMTGLVANNTKLIDYIVSKDPNSSEAQRSLPHISDILTPYLIKMAQAAVEDKVFRSLDEGIVQLGKWMHGDVVASVG